ncbi:APC family permease [Streptomyces sp. Li-HN-5-11]|uniref:APC family permease n=1 Tax=Streptomyces sp. Li-HN-5-11 TaxID=3075432 RepID=UPI0028A66A25|nr:APC family permease [Streptomyces sp. Li-HN-5-11]WNM35714.1 APC family permease [Streptomyces sp. Li-HN-5-11]
MTTTPTGAEAATEQYQLKRHSLGVAGIVFFVMSAAAPLAATLGSAPITFGATGQGAPGAYLLVGIVLLCFAAGYAAMSRHVTSSAGFAAYIERGLGRVAGFAGATTAVFSYVLMLIGIYGAFGYFTRAIVLQRLHVDLPWGFWALAAVAVVAVLGYVEVNLSAKVLGVLMVAEMALLVAFDVVTPAQGGADGVSLAAFAPANVFHGDVGIAILFAAASFIGFEATAIYGEEAREPRKTVPRATYTAVISICAFYAITTWAIGLAYKSNEVQGTAAKDPANFVLAANTRFVGQWSTGILNVLLITSYFATLVAFHNTIARYMYSLGRGGVLPSPLRRTHRRWQSPHVASVAGSLVTTIVVAAFVIGGADPFLQMFAWLTGLGTVGVLVLQASTSVSAIVFFRRQRVRVNTWSGTVAPLLGAVGIVTAIVLAVVKWKTFTGATGGFGAQMPWLLVAAALAGLLLAWVKRHTVRTISAGFAENGTTRPEAPVSGIAVPAPSEDAP